MKKLLFLIFLLFSKLAFSIDIDDAIKSTIENNPKVRIAYEKLTESKELIENAYNQKLPTITSTISGTYSTSDSSTSTATTTPETFTDKYKLSLTQNLYHAGEKSNGTKLWQQRPLSQTSRSTRSRGGALPPYRRAP